MEKYNPKLFYVVEVKTLAIKEKYLTINEMIKSEWDNPEIVLGYVASKNPKDLLLMLVNSLNGTTLNGTLFVLNGELPEGYPRILNRVEIEDW